MSLAARLLARRRVEQRFTTEDFIALMAGMAYRPTVEQTQADGTTVSSAVATVSAHAARYAGSSPVFSLIAWRTATFSGGRFRWRRVRDGRPSDFYGTPALRLLERPWVGGTTQDLLARVELDVSLAGNAYVTSFTRPRGTGVGAGVTEMVRLPPDQVDIVLEPIPGLGWRKLGYLFHPDPSRRDPRDATALTLDQVAHVMPYPDPESAWRGMSWLTPLIRDVLMDDVVTRHEIQYFRNAATPNLFMKYPIEVAPEKIRAFAALMKEQHAGPDNAGRTLHVGGGADPHVAGANLKDAEARLVRAAGETRIASAAGVPPILVGFHDGLDSATYSNYGQARRRYVDATLHTLWATTAGSLETIVPPPDAGTELVVDGRDVPLLRDDSKDEAEIRQMTAATMRSLIDGGYTPESVARWAQSGDFGVLRHTGLFSVQLQRPGTTTTPTTIGTGSDDAGDGQDDEDGGDGG